MYVVLYQLDLPIHVDLHVVHVDPVTGTSLLLTYRGTVRRLYVRYMYSTTIAIISMVQSITFFLSVLARLLGLGLGLGPRPSRPRIERFDVGHSREG